MKQVLISLFFLIPMACFGQNDFMATRVTNIAEMRVADFIAEVQQYNRDSISTYVFSIMDKAPKGWIKKEDIPMLMQHIRSDKPCKCVVSMFSSQVPERNERSTLGGIAMDMIDAYRKQEPYPSKLTMCTTGDKKRAAGIDIWWNAESKK